MVLWEQYKKAALTRLGKQDESAERHKNEEKKRQ
jgi:hypothetical protein